MKILIPFFCLLACCLTVEAVTVFPASTNGNNVFTGTNSFTKTIHGNSTNISVIFGETSVQQEGLTTGLNTNVVYFSGLGIISSAFTSSSVDMSSANGPWNWSGFAYTNGIFGTVTDIVNQLTEITNAAHNAVGSDVLIYLSIGEAIAPTAIPPEGTPRWSDAVGFLSVGTTYGTNSASTNLISGFGQLHVGQYLYPIYHGDASGLTNITDILNQVSNSSLLHIGRTTFSNSVTTRLQTNSVIVTNGNIILPARYNIGDGGGGIFWHIPTNALVGTPTELTELGFCTVFRDWDGFGHNWLQFASENVRVESGWGNNPGSGDVVLGNELGVNQVWINYSQGTNTQGMMMGTPLFFPVNDNVHFMELPGISSVIVSNTVIQNTFGVSPGELWFYSMAPMQWGDKRPGYIDDSIVTAKMHTNTWEFTHGVAIDSSAVASWPTNACSANQVLLVVSNTTLFSLHTALNSTAWAATNKISGP